MTKKITKNDSDMTPEDYFRALMEKYSKLGRWPTPEEAAEDNEAFRKFLFAPTKSQVTARKIQKLNEYIELANMLPPDIPMLDLGLIARSIDSSLEEGTISFTLGKFRVLLQFLGGANVPAAFREYVLEGVDNKALTLNFDFQDTEFVYLHSGISTALRRYDECRDVRNKLRAIARVSAQPTPEKPWNVTASFDVIIDSDGKLQWSGNTFAETIQGLEAARIRECPICQRIFWANPKSKMSCSPRCRNVFNVRKHRETTKKNRRDIEKKGSKGQ